LAHRVVLIGCVLVLLAPWAQAQETYGEADDPVVAEVHGMQIRTRDGEEMTYVIKQSPLQRYAQQKGLAATDTEIREYIEKTRDIARQDRENRKMRRGQIIEALKSGSLAASDRETLKSELDALDEMRRMDLESDQSGQDDAGEEEARAAVAKAFIEQWKVNRALYRQYGGRVIFQQGGAEPLDAYRNFLENAQANGDFAIFEKRFEPVFWKYYTTDSMHTFCSDDGDAKDRAIDTPW
jgi:hypothetical protein